MIYIFTGFMLVCGYYSLTYGIFLWKQERNKLGGGAMAALAILGTLVPAIAMIIKA